MTNDIQFTVELLGRIVLAAVCGIAVGYERMNHFKAAGVKTHMIVGLSASLMMIVSKYGFSDSPSFDAARVAAQVVSGVGFLGAGIIFKKNQSVQGLTTAAGIWGTAGVGLALGSGLYYVGVFGTVIFILLRVAVQHVDHFQNGLQESFCISVDHMNNFKDLLDICENLKLVSYSMEHHSTGDIQLDVTILFTDDEQKKHWIEQVLSRKDIVKFETC